MYLCVFPPIYSPRYHQQRRDVTANRVAAMGRRLLLGQHGSSRRRRRPPRGARSLISNTSSI